MPASKQIKWASPSLPPSLIAFFFLVLYLRFMTLFRVFPCFFREMCVWFWSVRAVFVPVRSLYGSFHSLSSHHACLSPAVELPSPESCQVIRIISPRDNLNVTFFGPLRASNLSHRFCIVLRKFWWFPKMQLRASCFATSCLCDKGFFLVLRFRIVLEHTETE